MPLAALTVAWLMANVSVVEERRCGRTIVGMRI